MKRWIKRLQAWRAQRQQRSLELWEQVRAEGKARFVFRATLTWSLTMIGAMDVTDHIFHVETQFSTFLVRAVGYTIGGVVVASAGWSSQEAKYKNARIKLA